jgi:DNA-binding HxlR family transcriptional regulator
VAYKQVTIIDLQDNMNEETENKFQPTADCPIRNVLNRLGDKWSILALVVLNANGTMRFSDLHKNIQDISPRMLTVTLRTLEADGLVNRKVYPEVPPRVEYCLTDIGKGLILHVNGLIGWAINNMPEIMRKRALNHVGK